VHEFLTYLVIGIVYGATYAVTASGLVVTYATSGVFNFAHGAIGMVAAYVFWALHVAGGMPSFLAAAIVVLVLAPLAGAAIERGLVRGLHGAPVTASIGVTVGLMLALVGIASVLWDPDITRIVPSFFSQSDLVRVAGVNITYDQVMALIVAAVVAVALRLLLYQTRAGMSMRAVVDDPTLVALAGRSPARSAQLGWVVGASLAAAGGVLVATQQLGTLDIEALTFLVVSAYAAAIVGRLRSVPLTFVGAMVLGIAVSFTNSSYIPQSVSNNLQLYQTMPMVLLFLVLLVLPHGRLRTHAAARGTLLRVPSLRTSIAAGVLLVAVTWVVSGFISRANVDYAAEGLALALVMLSLVPLTGYAGQISLCQLTFAGLGAFAMGKVAGGASPLGLLAAVGLAGGAGLLVALPAIRLRGLYLALATLAFASAMDSAFFGNTNVMTLQLVLQVGRSPVFGMSFVTDRSFLVLLSVVFALAAIGVVALRRSRFGRRLVAMNDSPAACATVGVSLVRTKLAVFGLSAALAGLAGALYGGVSGLVTNQDFQMLSSLAILLLATVWGIRSVTGVLLAGLSFVLIPLIPDASRYELVYVLSGLGAIAISRNPEGVIGDYVARLGALRERIGALRPRLQETAEA
jgi:branched-chain amino acid transport system permease protein